METKARTRKPAANRRQPGATAATKKPATVRTKSKESERPLQDVVYLPPKPFQRRRFLVRLATVAAVVVAIVLAMAVFFKVEYVEVSGHGQYTAQQIKEASGIKEGDNLFSFGLPNAAAKIKALPYVKSVRIGIKLPHTVMIEITEVQVTYAMKAQNDDWWLVSSDGKVVAQAEGTSQEDHPKILGVHLLNPQVGLSVVAQETTKPDVDENGNTIPVTVTDAQRLATAMELAQYLEANGILGQVVSIDVNNLGDIQMWYGTQYQVKLGDTSQLAYKISSMKSAIDELNKQPHNSGVLDVSFTVNSDGVIYTGFQ